MTLPASPQSLILPAQAGEGAKALGVAALPDSAQICSCLNVSKADIREAVRAGASDMAALKAATGGTGCRHQPGYLRAFPLIASGVVRSDPR